jgi:hypothetical protein
MHAKKLFAFSNEAIEVLIEIKQIRMKHYGDRDTLERIDQCHNNPSLKNNKMMSDQRGFSVV